MQKSQIDSLTLVAVTLAAALALLQISGPLAWLSSIGGLVLLLVLFGFDQEGYRNVFQSLAFSAVSGFCLAIACGGIFQLLANHGEVHLGDNHWATEYMPLTWALATGILWAIDVMRMSSRKSAPIHVPRALGETRIFAESAIPAPAPQSPRGYYQPPAAPAAPVYQAPQPAAPVYHAPEPPPAPAPIYQPPQPPAPAPVYAQPPVYRAPVETPAPPPPPPVEPAPAPVPVQSTPEYPTATSFFAIPPDAAPAPSQPLNPGPAPIISQSGKEAMIYVSLLGEGLNVLRSVRAEPLGRDFYRIIDEMPEGETWQFQPGQIVRCKKKSLSSGKAMVATEEAPRSA